MSRGNVTTRNEPALNEGMECITCPLCESDDADVLFERRDLTYGITDVAFMVVRCRRCALVYVNPRPTEIEIHKYYPEEFYDPVVDADQLLRDKQELLSLKYSYVKDITPGRLLEIGCAKGEFMMFMKQHGWNVSGVDFSNKPPNVFGLDIRYGSIESADFDDNSFDLVALWAVLEHVYSPKRMLREVCRLLKPGGALVLLVTNFNSLPARLMRQDDVPRHTTLFTSATISRLLKATGFTVNYVRCDHRLYGGTNRGLMNFLFKLAAGESIDEIVAQSRSASRWQQFSSELHGRKSPWMLKVDKADMSLTPRIDPVLDRLGLGFIMVVRAQRRAESCP